MSGKGRKRQRGQRGEHIEPEKASVHRKQQNKGHHGYKKGAQQGHKPQGDALQQAHALNGGHDLAGQGRRCGYGAAQPAHHGLGDTAADFENRGHNLHRTAHGGFGKDKADQVAQHIFRPLEVTKAGGALKNCHSEKQHQKTVADPYQGIVDIEDQPPYGAAFERLRGLGQQRPYLGQLTVPAGQGAFQVADDPVVTQKITSESAGKCVSR